MLLKNLLKFGMKQQKKTTENVDNVKSLYEKNDSNFKSQIQRVNKLEINVISMEEKSDQDKRKCNIIFYDIPESSSSDITERMQHDCLALKDIFKRNGKTFQPDDIVNVIRLRKNNVVTARPAPMLVVLTSEEYKKQLLKYCTNLKYLNNNESKPIYYSLDLTPRERAERRNLVTELKSRRLGGENNINKKQ